MKEMLEKVIELNDIVYLRYYLVFVLKRMVEVVILRLSVWKKF